MKKLKPHGFGDCSLRSNAAWGKKMSLNLGLSLFTYKAAGLKGSLTTFIGSVPGISVLNVQHMEQCGNV